LVFVGGSGGRGRKRFWRGKGRFIDGSGGMGGGAGREWVKKGEGCEGKEREVERETRSVPYPLPAAM